MAKKNEPKEDKSKKEAEKPEEVKEDTKAEAEEAPSENVRKDIVEEEKEQEAAEKEQDYNSIFDDEYVEKDDKKDSREEVTEPEETVAEEPEETAPEEEPEEEAEVTPEPKEERPQKQEKKKVKKKAGKFSKKRILVILAAILLLLLGAFLGWKFFTMKNEIKEVKEETTTTTKPKVKESKVVYVTADNGLNMRENPDAKSKSLAIIPNGTKLTVLEEKDGWYKVEYNGQTGWVSKDFVTETTPDDMKTYTGTGFSADAPKFSIKYPSDWVLNGYKVSKTDNGKTYTIALGEGGHGFAEDDPTITSANEDVTYNGLPAKKTTVKKNGNIILIVVNFTKGNDYTNIEFTVPDGYDQPYIDTFDKMLATFKYL